MTDLKVYRKNNGANIIIPPQLVYFIDILQQYDIDMIAITEWIDVDECNVCMELYLPEKKVYILFETDTFQVPFELKKKLFKKYKKLNLLIGNWKDLLYIIIEKLHK